MLLSVQVSVAAVGETVGEWLLHPLKAKAGAVLTVRLTAVEALQPVLGIAVSVPLYVPGAVPDVAVTVPQVAPAPQAPVGPLTVTPLMAE